MSALISPLQLRSISLRNRIMISPMCQYSAGTDGFATDWHIAHYGRFAMGGAGLVMLEATAVVPQGRLSHGDLGIWSDAHVAGLARIARLIRSEGAVAGIQLGHAGRKASTHRPWQGDTFITTANVIAADQGPWRTESVGTEPGWEGAPAPHALDASEIPALVSSWAAAARRAAEAGFDVVEIHGAHGYLINTFLSPLTNRRDDAYGGVRRRRMQLALDVAEAVRENWPSSLPLFFRVSSVDAARDGWTLEDTVALAFELRARGVDVIDCSSGGIGADYTVIPRGPCFQVPFAAAVRRAADVASVAVGLITRPEQAESIVARGEADIVAIGREALFNPMWPLHARLALEPEHRFHGWPAQSGWWLARRKGAAPAI